MKIQHNGTHLIMKMEEKSLNARVALLDSIRDINPGCCFTLEISSLVGVGGIVGSNH